MILGITGAFGCGKSSVLAAFAARGWRTADADQICHGFYGPGGPLAAALTARWGRGILLESGEADRRKLAALVFADPAELEALTGGKIDMQLVKDAWPRIIFTSETNKKGMEEFVGYAFKCGFLKEQLDLSKIFTDAGK